MTIKRDSAINMRAYPEQRDLIDTACALLNKDRSDFMLETACREAQNVILDQRFFNLDAESFDAFEAELNRPMQGNKLLMKLLIKKSPWQD